MSVKRFIPNKDSFITDGLIGQELNVGKDELLELGKCDREGTEGSSRILLGFGEEVSTFVDTISNYSASLHLYSTRVDNLPEKCNFEFYKINKHWQEGFGRVNDIKINSLGVTWNNRETDVPWEEGDIESIPFKEITYQGTDLDVGIENIQNILGEGIEIKLKDEQSVEDVGTRIVFFGRDTHTIYQPYLNIEWDDSIRESTLEELQVPSTIVAQNLREYVYGEKVQLKLGVIPSEVKRIFSTASLYRQNYILPEESYWGIKNDFTAERVIPFGYGTKISADNSGSYFTLDTELLEPERYYTLEVKVKDLVFRVGTFKIVRSGKL